MKSDVFVHDPLRCPIIPREPVAVHPSLYKVPSKFRRRKMYTGVPVSRYNGNFKRMPEGF